MRVTAAALLLALAILTWPGRPGAERRPRVVRARRSQQGDPSVPPAPPALSALSAPPAMSVLSALSAPSVPPAAPRSALRGRRRTGGAALRRTLARGWSGADDGLEERAEFAELLALCLRSGLPPRDALQIARQDSSSVHPRVVSMADGLAVLNEGSSGPAPPVSSVTDTGSSLVLAAWTLGLECGAPLTEAVEAGARALRDKAAARRRATTARAGPRATMWLLTVLPVAGPLATLAVGSDPTATFGQPVAVLSLAAGLTLTGTGWWWSRWLLRRAEAATVYQ